MSTIRIPETFKLLGTTWKVRQDNDQSLDDQGVFGTMSMNRQEICISSVISPQMKRQVFYHELAHAVLEMSNQNETSKDEAAVELIGHMFHQYLDTKKGTLPL